MKIFAAAILLAFSLPLALADSNSDSPSIGKSLGSTKTNVSNTETATSQRRVPWGTDTLEEREGLIYVKGETEPYPGITYELYENGNIKTEFNYKNGKQNGKGIMYYENGNKAHEAMVVNGFVEGSEIEWWENGKKKSEKFIKDGRPEGPVTEWWENGNMRRELTYKNGHAHGKVTQWKENGELFQTYSVKPVVVK